MRADQWIMLGVVGLGAYALYRMSKTDGGAAGDLVPIPAMPTTSANDGLKVGMRVRYALGGGPKSHVGTILELYPRTALIREDGAANSDQVLRVSVAPL